MFMKPYMVIRRCVIIKVDVMEHSHQVYVGSPLTCVHLQGHLFILQPFHQFISNRCCTIIRNNAEIKLVKMFDLIRKETIHEFSIGIHN